MTAEKTWGVHLSPAVDAGWRISVGANGSQLVGAGGTSFRRREQ